MKKLVLCGLALAMMLVSLSACGADIDDELSSTNSHEQVIDEPSETDDNDTTGTYRPYVGNNGVGFGIDIGGGVVFDPSTGGIGFGF